LTLSQHHFFDTFGKAINLRYWSLWLKKFIAICGAMNDSSSLTAIAEPLDFPGLRRPLFQGEFVSDHGDELAIASAGFAP